MINSGMTKRELQITDLNEIKEILAKCKYLHLGLVDGDEPYVVPMNYGHAMEDGKLTLYLHGGLKGKKLDLMRVNPKVFFEMVCDVTPFEGARPCQHGVTYASIMGRGKATIVEDMEEKKKGLELLMKTQTGKDFTFEDRWVTIVSVIRIDVLDYTAKRRPLPAALQEKQSNE